MDRLACVDVPALPLQVLMRRRPEWAELPAAVVDEDRPQGTLLWINERARKRGVLPGHRWAAALTLCPDLVASVVPPDEIEKSVALLVERLSKLSPGVEAAKEDPGVFWLDARGLAAVFTSASSWAEQIRQTLLQNQFRSAVVVGFQRFFVYAVARWLAGERTLVFSTPAQEKQTADRVPLSRLAMNAQSRDTLKRLGITTVGQLAQLPGAGLRRRFGPELFRIHRMARGEFLAPLAPHHEEEPLTASLELDEPDDSRERLTFMAKRLLDGLIFAAGGRGLAISGLTLKLKLKLRASGLSAEPVTAFTRAQRIATGLSAKSGLVTARTGVLTPAQRIAERVAQIANTTQRADAAERVAQTANTAQRTSTGGDAAGLETQTANTAQRPDTGGLAANRESKIAVAPPIEPPLAAARSVGSGPAAPGRDVQAATSAFAPGSDLEASASERLASPQHPATSRSAAGPSQSVGRVVSIERAAGFTHPRRMGTLPRETSAAGPPPQGAAASPLPASSSTTRTKPLVAEKHFAPGTTAEPVEVADEGLRVETVAPAHPTLDGVQLLSLLKLRLEAVELPAGVEKLTLDAEAVPASADQLKLLAKHPKRDLVAAGRAFARLRAAFGLDAVVRAIPDRGHLPERRFAFEALNELPEAHPSSELEPMLIRRISTKAEQLPACEKRDSDGWMLRGIEHGPVDKLHGPFRLSGAWWHREVSRDYFFAELRGGSWVWVYFDRQRRRWFLQGEVA